MGQGQEELGWLLAGGGSFSSTLRVGGRILGSRHLGKRQGGRAERPGSKGTALGAKQGQGIPGSSPGMQEVGKEGSLMTQGRAQFSESPSSRTGGQREGCRQKGESAQWLSLGCKLHRVPGPKLSMGCKL